MLRDASAAGREGRDGGSDAHGDGSGRQSQWLTQRFVTERRRRRDNDKREDDSSCAGVGTRKRDSRSFAHCTDLFVVALPPSAAAA